MLRYMKLYLCFLKNSVIREMAFRVGFFAQMLGSGIQFAVQVLFFNLIYLHTKAIAGWTMPETMFLLATNHLIGSLGAFLFGANLGTIPHHVRNGTLDMILIKPVNAQFFVSIRNVGFSSLPNTLFSLPIFYYSIGHLDVSITFIQMSFYLLLVICGVFIRYSLQMIAMTTSFWTTNVTALYLILFDLFNLTGYPAEIFKGGARIIFSSIVPIIVIANFPTKVIIKAIKFWPILYVIIITLFFLLISRLFWNLSLRKYSSASS